MSAELKDFAKLKKVALNELERSVVLEKQVEEASAFNVKDQALALARSQRKLIALLCQVVFQSGHQNDARESKGGGNG
ncbi:hypothetical protein [Pseudoalteromonas rubra]|uniref:hypothetical protein n=1 Tax=Pseudoalteromonas rubra TaxID=43658 RepID=UPI002DBC7988|nr:hypothetical protein [Pseudoalteromonas rubra]MEC4091140.1 hypothetical protein [Pseudoalteromonas rubra]